MRLEQFFHDIKVTWFGVFHSGWLNVVLSIAVLLFAIAFISVGVSRWVEFLDFGFSKLRRRVLITLHLVGCVALSIAFFLFAIDADRRFVMLIMMFLGSALTLLFPIHIYLGLLRRKYYRARERQ